MEKYLELAARHGMSGEDALKFAAERMDKDAEREERRLERDKEREREKEEREREREEREKERKHEIEKLQYQSELQNMTKQAIHTVQTPKIPPFVEGRDEMDSYLLRFEKFASAAAWEEDQWAVSLSALLTGKALDIYYRLEPEQSSDYNQLKQALLRSYGLTAEGYRKKLRESRPEEDETPGQFVVRLKAYLKRWIEMGETDDTRDGLKELIIQEQFMEICPAGLRLFLKERDLSSLEEMTETAQQYLEARGVSLSELSKKHQWNSEAKSHIKHVREPGKAGIARSASALQVNARAGQQKCAFCEQHHDPDACQDASRLTVEERRQRLLASGCCFLCLRPRHIASTCESQRTCAVCHRKHHELLCFESDPKNNKKPAQVLAARSQVGNKTGVALQTACVEAVGPVGKERVRMLLDTGSNQSFVTKRLAMKLGCKTTGEQDTQIVTFGGTERCHKSMKKVSVTLKKTGDTSSGLTMSMAQIDTICGPVNAGLTIDEAELTHLEGIELADPPEQWRGSQQIDILLGMDFYQDVMTGRTRRNPSGLIAMESIFGWILGGRVSANEDGGKQALFVRTQTSSEDLERIWDLESIGIRTPLFESAREEKRVLEDSAVIHFESTCTRLDDGRYEVRWPKNDNFSCLPDGDRLARARLDRCETALERSGRRLDYEKAIMQYSEDGYAEIAPSTPDGPVHVMSHHAVYKNDKIRIVFDASAGHPYSLNDCVLPGPNLIADLAGILLRFRLHPVAVSADIEKAFLQISLHPEERDVTRFLWRENPGEEPTVFRMTRVVFGVSASPFLLQATIKRHLSLYAESQPQTVLRLATDLYCDDLLTSLKTEEEADSFVQETRQIFSEAKMNMRKWASNRRLAAVECNEPKTVLLPDEGTEERKVLGVVWAPEDDTLRFDPSRLVCFGDNMRPTKRNLLRISARIYDPLGLLTPFTVRTKMMLKRLWIDGKGWDEPMSDDLQKLWLAWYEELKQLEMIRIPRTYYPVIIESFEIHTFCDASQDAYAAAVYLRVSGEYPRKSRLMISKSRLAPTKPMCLARLELMAAVIGARLTEYVLTSLGSQPDSVHLWTDSAVALAWIRSNPQRWGTFVSNRVVEVQQKFPPECWRHCPGESNPADLPSRGCSVKKMQKDLWQNGPAWLELPEMEWPRQDLTGEPPACKKEEKRNKTTPVLLSNSRAESSTGHGLKNVIDINRFSTLGKLHRVTAWVLRWNAIRTGPTVEPGELTTEELQNAESIWLKEIQQETYEEELSQLQTADEVGRQCSLYSLNPIVDQGLLKVRGRLQEADLKQEEKHPIIIPPDHKYTQLLIIDHHQRACHGGVQQTLHSLRERFWIPRGRQIVQKTIRGCQMCKIFCTKAFNEDAAPLPKERVRQRPPFSAVGVDLAGPIYRKEHNGSNTLKTWFVLFTCTVVRAVHIELVESQSAEDFMKAYERFASRRGSPEVIFSDNGLNFKGASKILASRGIKWKFNVQRAPWWGGFWERLIRLTKEALRRTLRRSLLTWEELSTVLCQIEAAINARPLTALNDDPDDIRPLSPQDFLLEKARTDYQGTTIASASGQELRSMRTYRLQVLQHLWKRWKVEYLRELRLPLRSKMQRLTPREQDLVIIEDNPRSSPTMWKTGVIEKLHRGRDDRVRAATVRTTDGTLERPIQRLHLLEGAPS